MAPGDTRITTRYSRDEFAGSFFGVLHETGHALYEQGLPKSDQVGLPLGESVSLGIHESQSRMWENLVGRSRSFWRHVGPIAREALPALRDLTDDALLAAVNDVRPSFIRTESDEVTYNLHIVMRFELECALIDGSLSVRDLPGAWDEKMRDNLGITPTDPARGCLQDIHWAAGLVGYFPTYTLGNLYAAQFFEQARHDLGDLDAMFSRGEFAPLLHWLREKIHRHGRRYSAEKLVQSVTGKSPSAQPLLGYLQDKVATYYG
jgi:carboxypeptidase Taq